MSTVSDIIYKMPEIGLFITFFHKMLINKIFHLVFQNYFFKTACKYNLCSAYTAKE